MLQLYLTIADTGCVITLIHTKCSPFAGTWHPGASAPASAGGYAPVQFRAPGGGSTLGHQQTTTTTSAFSTTAPFSTAPPVLTLTTVGAPAPPPAPPPPIMTSSPMPLPMRAPPSPDSTQARHTGPDWYEKALAEQRSVIEVPDVQGVRQVSE